VNCAEQLTVLEEGDGPSLTSENLEEEEGIDQSPPQPAVAASASARTSLPQMPSTEDLSGKKKTPSRIAGASGLRAPTAGRSEILFFLHLVSTWFPCRWYRIQGWAWNDCEFLKRWKIVELCMKIRRWRQKVSNSSGANRAFDGGD